MEQQRLDYLERLIILNYLEVQHMKKALYAKLEIEDDSHTLFHNIEEDLDKLLEQKGSTLRKLLDERSKERKRHPWSL